MKFNEKLIKLRKENKMSQEKLADLLNVSRQLLIFAVIDRLSHKYI